MWFVFAVELFVNDSAKQGGGDDDGEKIQAYTLDEVNRLSEQKIFWFWLGNLLCIGKDFEKCLNSNNGATVANEFASISYEKFLKKHF